MLILQKWNYLVSARWTTALKVIGSIYRVVPARKISSKQPGEWNAMTIVAKGPQVKIVHNGETLVDANLKEYEQEHAERHPGILREKGHLGFQSYNTRVEFRNIYLKPL